jgi:hypothetical protein
MTALLESPGNFILVVGDEDAKRGLRGIDNKIDDWLYELVDSIAFQAADRLRVHAPGSIPDLVGVDLTSEENVGAFEATAGVEPDFSLEDFGHGLGSDPADYPVYVDQGTGIYGEKKTPITVIPGNFMTFFVNGRRIFTNIVQGQPAQHFSQKANDDTMGWVPMRIEFALKELEAKIKA